MKKELIEIQSSANSPTLRVVESGQGNQKPGVLATLEGIFSETESETQNGRAYSNALWRRQVESEELQSRLRNLQLLGEADHPEGLETSITRVSHVITDLELRENQNVLWGKLDVLDTPSGRIVKTLLDYGWKPGISSRGAGEILSSTNRNEINPDTYDYVVHDLVVDPACRNAHLEAVSESRHSKATLKEALNRLAEQDREQYLKDEVFFKNLFESKFGITLSTESSSPVTDTQENAPTQELTQKVTELGEAVTTLHRKLEKATEDQGIQAKAHRALVESYNKVQEENLRLKEQSEIKLKEAQGRIAFLRTNLNTIQEGMQNRIDALVRKNASGVKRLQSLTASLSSVKEALSRKRKTESGLRKQLKSLQTELAEAKAQISSQKKDPGVTSTQSGTARKVEESRTQEKEDLGTGTPRVKRSGKVSVGGGVSGQQGKTQSFTEAKDFDERLDSIIEKAGPH